MLSVLTRGFRRPSSVARPATMSPVGRVLLADPRMAWLWLVVRLAVGYEWFAAGWEKLTGQMLPGVPIPTSAWVFTGHDGDAMRQFAAFAIMKAPGGKFAGQYPEVQTWYAAFLQHIVLPHSALFAYLITFGELFVGIGLLVGAVTGVTAFFGVVMNVNYLLAGTISLNPILLLLGIGLILARRIAGRYGVDGACAALWPGLRTRLFRGQPDDQSRADPRADADLPVAVAAGRGA